jgi:hypothetical protein
MGDAGYDYSDPESFLAAAVAQFSARANAIVGENHPQDPTEGWTQDEIDSFFAHATEEEVVALYDHAQPELTADQREQLEETLAEEVTLGLAEHSCSLGIRDEAAEVYADVEETYVLEHEDELTALAASVADED